MNPLVKEFNDRIQDLDKLAAELDKDFCKVKSSEESLLIEGVVNVLRESKRDMKRVIALEECRAS